MQDEKDAKEDLKEAAHRVWLAGLGALAAAGEEGSRIFELLVERGRGYAQAGRTWDEEIDSKVSAALRHLGVPTRDELQVLTRRLDDLLIELERLESRNREARLTADSGLPGTSITNPK